MAKRTPNKNNPSLKRFNTFFNFLQTNEHHKIIVNPSTASQFIKNLTMSDITDFQVVKSELKSVVAKNKKDAEAFDSLFDLWFTDNYGITPEAPEKTFAKLHAGATAAEIREAILEAIGYVEEDKEGDFTLTEENVFEDLSTMGFEFVLVRGLDMIYVLGKVNLIVIKKEGKELVDKGRFVNVLALSSNRYVTAIRPFIEINSIPLSESIDNVSVRVIPFKIKE